MINWKDEKLRTLLEGVGIVSLLLGLIFVGFELRQNTAAVQAATMQGLTDASQEYLLLLASDPELMALRRKGRRTPDQLSEIEADQYRLLIRTRWLRFQNAFLSIDVERWEMKTGLFTSRFFVATQNRLGRIIEMPYRNRLFSMSSHAGLAMNRSAIE